MGVCGHIPAVAGLWLYRTGQRHRSFGLVIAASAVLACQSPRADFPEMDEPILPRPVGIPAALPTPEPGRAPATLYRDEVAQVVDAGLGHFLRHVEVDASLEHGHFRGFRILRLVPPEYWRGVDLQTGDVVTSVNGSSIERPPQAHRTFSALKSAEQLVVSYERAGEPRQLVFRITERPVRRAASRPLPVSAESPKSNSRKRPVPAPASRGEPAASESK